MVRTPPIAWRECVVRIPPGLLWCTQRQSKGKFLVPLSREFSVVNQSKDRQVWSKALGCKPNIAGSNPALCSKSGVLMVNLEIVDLPLPLMIEESTESVVITCKLFPEIRIESVTKEQAIQGFRRALSFHFLANL